ncbi:MAG: hypothetical protein JXA14_11705 [Anaerolineae bacterium]|nr:hypothetical protein [Anaerolineae bacterium]
MTQRGRIILAIGGVVFIAVAIAGVEIARRATSEPKIPPGSVPIYANGQFVAAFTPDDLAQLEQASFVDAEEGKTQEGWMLRDVLLLHFAEADLSSETTITVSSSSRDKSAQLTWAEVSDAENMVMFDLSGRGTLKLVSKLERLDVRDEWVQDVDKIDIDKIEVSAP